jgi:hypothetical protein
LTIAQDSVLVLEGAPALLVQAGAARRVRRLFATIDESERADRMQADYRARTGEDLRAARAAYAARSADETPVILDSAALADITINLEYVQRRDTP